MTASVVNPDKSIGLSSSSFALIMQGQQLLDKSRCMVEFLQEKTAMHLLLRPRRSG
jgi:hypothetical protein